MGTLTLIHKSVTMDWIKHTFIEPEKEVKRDHWKLYYQYKGLEDNIRKMRIGEVISGFII
jgi:hypothetical protein